MSHVHPMRDNSEKARYKVEVVIPPYDHEQQREHCECYRIRHDYQDCGHVYVYSRPGPCATREELCETRRPDVRNHEEDERTRFRCFPCQANNLFGNMTREELSACDSDSDIVSKWDELEEWNLAFYLEDVNDNDRGLRAPLMINRAYSLPRTARRNGHPRSQWTRFNEEPKIIGEAAEGYCEEEWKPSGRSKRWARDMQLDPTKLTQMQLAVLPPEEQQDLAYLDRKIPRKKYEGVSCVHAKAYRIEKWVMDLPKHFLNPYMELDREILLTTIKYDFRKEANKDPHLSASFGVPEMLSEVREELSEDGDPVGPRMSTGTPQSLVDSLSLARKRMSHAHSQSTSCDGDGDKSDQDFFRTYTRLA